MSVMANKSTGDRSTWTDGDKIKKGLREVLAKYPDMGGRCCLEYNAVLSDEENGKSVHYPEKWSQMVYKLIHGRQLGGDSAIVLWLH